MRPLLILFLFLPGLVRADQLALSASSSAQWGTTVGVKNEVSANSSAFRGFRLEAEYFIGEQRGVIVGLSWLRSYQELIDLRTTTVAKYNSETSVPALVLGGFWTSSRNIRLVGNVKIGKGSFSFQDLNAELPGMNRQNVFIAEFDGRMDFLIQLYSVYFFPYIGVTYHKPFMEVFEYDGRQFESTFTNSNFLFSLGLGIGF